jgi:hypothetical protein
MASGLPLLVAAGLGFAGTYTILTPEHGHGVASIAFGSLGGAGCNIKGNVSINSGERIYHVPGQRYYAETAIRPEFGERYFCSEQEARAAGWRRSGI